MKYVFFLTIFIFFVLALALAFQFLSGGNYKYHSNRLVAAFCMSSAVWSLGFSIMIIQKEPQMAYYCRSAGMFGVFLYLIFAQMLVCYISKIKARYRHLFNGFAFLGIIVCVLVVQPKETVYYLSNFGMTYHFRAGLANNLYITYTVVIFINILVISIFMIRRSVHKRIREFGKKFIIVELCLVVGTVLDTVLPLLGHEAIPGSTIMQFLGLLVLCSAIRGVNRARVNISNMSEFIYYSLAMPVLVYDADEKLQIMNDSAAAFFDMDQENYSSEDTSINKLFDICAYDVFAPGDSQMNVDARCLCNQVYCNLSISKIADSYGDIIGYIVLVTDLSDRMKVMNQLEEARYEAVRANQAKSTFLANMSHEIRTPMNAIIGFSELALKEDFSDRIREYLKDIYTSAHNLLAIINDILDFSKIECGKMELVCQEYEFGALLHDVDTEISNLAKKKGLDFSVETDSALPGILYGDANKLRGILVNLLNNAVKYTKEGFVKLTITVLSSDQESVSLRFDVADSGIGIREEDKDKLFESFSQTDYKVHYNIEGTGLGLAIVKGYVELMGGSVSVESVYREGSTFTVVVSQKIVDAKPADFAEEKASVQENVSTGQLKIADTKVLVVDDNQINLKVAERALAYYGLAADTVSGGAEAVERCKEESYDFIFMDQMMPGMDGVEAMKKIRQLKEFDNKCKIIVLTANAIEGVRDDLLEEGFDEYLSKPMDLYELEQVLLRFVPQSKISYEDPDRKEDSTENEKISQILPDMLSGVDVTKGIANCGGQLTDYLAVLQLLERDGAQDLAELSAMLEKGSDKEFVIKIHALKGLCLNIGADDTAALAKELETAAKNGEMQFVSENTPAFSRQYGELLAKIHRFLQSQHMSAQAYQERVADGCLTWEDFTDRMKEIEKDINDFDFAAAATRIRSLLKCPLTKEQDRVVSKMEMWMDELDTDKILERIREITG